ncbi:hypothetical protein Tco_1207469, partial [Tanacetum coccineum]
TMTKVIKEEFEKLESLKISDDSFTCNTSLEFFYKEFNQMIIMDDDLFTYEVEIPGLASVPCDINEEDDLEQQMTHGSDVDMEYDPSNVEFTKWLALKFYNHKTMDQYTKNALWIYWTRGDDEVELTYEESSDSDDDDDEVAKIFRIDTNKDDGYCNGGNLLGAYIVGNTLRYQNLEWHEALEDGKLKDEALKNKAIMEGMIDEDDESHNEGWRRWDSYENTIHDHEERDNKEKHEDLRIILTKKHRFSLEKKSTKLVKYQSSGIL